jgi:hypothetical protein
MAPNNQTSFGSCSQARPFIVHPEQAEWRDISLGFE